MSDAPLVSIITPTFNPGRRLERCLASVSSQTYSPIEHIVVDGGSTDGTLDVLGRVPGIRYVSEPDGGQADAINKGFGMARGSILGWLNADDVLRPGAVKATADALRSGESGWTIGDVVVVSEGHGEVERPAQPDKPQTWRARNVAAQPGSFISRWALEKVGFLDPSFHYMMDLDLWLRLIDGGAPHRYLPEVLAVFEVHSDSKSGSVPHSHFLVDDARARWKSGRFTDAAFAFGRAIAWGLQRGSTRDDVDAELSILFGPSRQLLTVRDVDQGFRTEKAILALKQRRLSAAVPLVNPRLWSHAAYRSRIAHLIGRVLTRRSRIVSSQEVSCVLADVQHDSSEDSPDQ